MVAVPEILAVTPAPLEVSKAEKVEGSASAAKFRACGSDSENAPATAVAMRANSHQLACAGFDLFYLARS
jgi:hypothetical protein